MSKTSLTNLEEKLLQLVSVYKNLKQELHLQQEELKVLNKKIKKSRIDINTLKDENDRLKVANAMLGSEEHKRLMKTKVNRLIKDVEVCIAQLKN